MYADEMKHEANVHENKTEHTEREWETECGSHQLQEVFELEIGMDFTRTDEQEQRDERRRELAEGGQPVADVDVPTD